VKIGFPKVGKCYLRSKRWVTFAICFVIPRRKNAKVYFLLFLQLSMNEVNKPPRPLLMSKSFGD